MTSAPANNTASMETHLVHGGATNLLADATVAERHAESWRIKGQYYRNIGGGEELAKTILKAAAALQRVADQLLELKD